MPRMIYTPGPAFTLAETEPFRDIGLLVFFDFLPTTLRLCIREQTVEIERAREHSQSAISGMRPLVVWPIPIELDAVFIGITEVKRFAHTVVGRPIEVDTRA